MGSRNPPLPILPLKTPRNKKLPMKKRILCSLLILLIGGAFGIWTTFQNADSAGATPTIKDLGNYSYLVQIPEGPLPQKSLKKVLKKSPLGSEGQTVRKGDVATIHYQMVSWKTNKIVKSSKLERNGKPLKIEAGYDVRQGLKEKRLPLTGILVPGYLSQAVVGMKKGECHEVVLKAGTRDIPDDLDRGDAYLLVVDVIKVETPEEYKDPIFTASIPD